MLMNVSHNLVENNSCYGGSECDRIEGRYRFFGGGKKADTSPPSSSPPPHSFMLTSEVVT